MATFTRAFTDGPNYRRRQLIKRALLLLVAASVACALLAFSTAANYVGKTASIRLKPPSTRAREPIEPNLFADGGSDPDPPQVFRGIALDGDAFLDVDAGARNPDGEAAAFAQPQQARDAPDARVGARRDGDAHAQGMAPDTAPGQERAQQPQRVADTAPPRNNDERRRDAPQAPLDHRAAVPPDSSQSDRPPWQSLGETMVEVLGHVTEQAMNTGTALEGMRVCFLTAGLAGPVRYGGVGQAVLRQAVLYAEHGATVDVAYAGGPAEGTLPNWPDHFARMGLNYYFVPRGDPNGAYGTPGMRRAFDSYVWMRNRSREGVDYDLLVLHDIRAVGLYIQYARLTGVAFTNRRMAIMTHSHGSLRLSDFLNARLPLDGDVGLVNYAMERLTTELADVSLAPSEFYYSWMRANGYDLGRRDAWTRRWTMHLLTPHEDDYGQRVFDNDARYGTRVVSRKFGFFGRIDRLKGVLTLLAALDHLVAHAGVDDSLPEEVLFVGDAAILRVEGMVLNATDYIKRRHRLGQWPFPVRFATELDSVQVARKFVSENYIFVNPTNGETASTVTVELVSAGVPVITTNVCALPELFADKEMFREWSFARGEYLELAHLMQQAMKVGVPVNKPRLSNKRASRLYVAAAVAAVKYAEARERDAAELKAREGNEGSASSSCPLTIGVATRDRPDYLHELLKSLLAQRWYPPGTELIILDVASVNVTDVAKVVESFSGPLGNRGVKLRFGRWDRPAHISVARNAIMKQASGTYILYIDDDDVATVRMVERMYGAAKRTGADVVTGFAYNFDGPDNNRVYRRVSLAVGAAQESTLFVHHAGKSNVLVRAETLRRVGGCSLDDLTTPTPFVDWDMYGKLLAKGARVVVVPEATFLYRMESRNSIYYGSVGQDDRTFFAHAKRARGVCDAYGIPHHACAGITAAMQLLARPGGHGLPSNGQPVLTCRGSSPAPPRNTLAPTSTLPASPSPTHIAAEHASQQNAAVSQRGDASGPNAAAGQRGAFRQLVDFARRQRENREPARPFGLSLDRAIDVPAKGVDEAPNDDERDERVADDPAVYVARELRPQGRGTGRLQEETRAGRDSERPAGRAQEPLRDVRGHAEERAPENRAVVIPEQRARDDIAPDPPEKRWLDSRNAEQREGGMVGDGEAQQDVRFRADARQGVRMPSALLRVKRDENSLLDPLRGRPRRERPPRQG